MTDKYLKYVIMQNNQVREISWSDEPSTRTMINTQDYLKIIENYGKEKARTVRSSRKFLREIGMIDSKGNFIKKK